MRRLHSNDHLYRPESLPLWIDTVNDRHALAGMVSYIAKALPKEMEGSPPDTRRMISTNGCNVGFITTKIATNPYTLAIHLLELMELWNEVKKPTGGTYKRLRSHINSLIHFIKRYLLDIPEQIKLHYLQSVYWSLQYLFFRQKDPLPFYNLIYFNPYVYWINNGALQYVEILESGSQANVVKAYNLSDPSIFYAIKIFIKPRGCHREGRIMHIIQNKLSENLNIPRIFAQHCQETNAIIIQYINADSLTDIT